LFKLNVNAVLSKSEMPPLEGALLCLFSTLMQY